MPDLYKLCFIISHKYYRNYQSFIKLYVNNIIKYYGVETLIILVDNNSTYFDDIKEKLSTYSNIIFLINDIECKFEIGAYKVGITYIIDNNLLSNYDYFICSQDNFIANNKYDFNNLTNNSIFACPFNGFFTQILTYTYCIDICRDVLSSINLYDKFDEVDFCWCNSFILHQSVIIKFFDYIKNIKITVRRESEASERYLTRMFYELNNYKNFSIDGNMENLRYNCWTVDLYNTNCDHYFVKKVQQKNENT